MQFLIRLVLVLLAVVLFIPEPTRASIIFKPGQKAEYVPPGEEEINGNAAEIYQTAQSAEKENNLKRAIRAYKTLVKRHPKDALAPTALFRAAQLQEQTHQLTPAAESYLQLVERYASNPHFDEAIERSLILVWHLKSRERTMQRSRLIKPWRTNSHTSQSPSMPNIKSVTFG